MVNFLNLPTVEAPRNALMNFTPINNALSENRNALMQQQQLDMRKEEQTYQRGRDAKQDDAAKVKQLGDMASAYDRLTDPAQRQAGLSRILAQHPNASALGPEYRDPAQAFKLIAAEAGKWRDPREDRLKDLELQTSQARLGLINAQAAAANRKGSPDVDQRISDLMRFNIDPNSAEGQMYILNGKMPTKAYENKAYIAKQDGTVQGIEQGLQNLNRATDAYDDASFTNAVGPIQGSTPDGLLSSLPVNAARLGGEIMNTLQRGGTDPSEVRSKIIGDTETLAAAIKPLIRKPGEGVWTDQDQARLVSIVGDLAQSRSKDEYRRRLNNVRDRLRSNFNLDINFDAFSGVAPSPSNVAPTGNRGGRTPSDSGDWRSTFKRVE